MKKSTVIITLAMCLLISLMFSCFQPRPRFKVQFVVTGISANSRLSDPIIPWNGDSSREGTIWLALSVHLFACIDTDTIVTKMEWDPQQNAYVSNYKWSEEMMNRVVRISVYSSSRAITAPPGDVSPILRGVILRTKQLENETNLCSIELQHLVTNGTFVQGGSGTTSDLLQFVITGINLTTGCAQQGSDNRAKYLGF